MLATKIAKEEQQEEQDVDARRGKSKKYGSSSASGSRGATPASACALPAGALPRRPLLLLYSWRAWTDISLAAHPSFCRHAGKAWSRAALEAVAPSKTVVKAPAVKAAEGGGRGQPLAAAEAAEGADCSKKKEIADAKAAICSRYYKIKCYYW